MKNVMKKLMSMILTLALVVGMIGIMPMKAEAEEAYPVWDMTAPYEFTVVEPWSGDRIELSVSETGVYRLYSTDRGESDPCATIYTSDGDQLAYNDDDSGSWEFSLTVYLEAGTVYYLEPTARTAGDTFKVNAEFMGTPEVELHDYSTISLYEENNGEYYYDENGDEYFYYYFDSSLWTLTFKLDYAGKESEIYTYDEMISNGYVVEYSDSQAESHWGVGEHSYTVSVLGYEFQVPINIVECPFESFVITKNPTAKYVLNDGDFVWESEDGYYLDARILSGIEAEFTRADGSTFTLDYEGICATEYPISVAGTFIDGVGTYEVNCYIINSGSTFEAEVIAAPDAQEISAGTEYENLDEMGYAWYSLDLEDSSRYYFYLNSHNGETGNVYFRLLDEDLNCILSSEDYYSEGSDTDCELEGGQTYYICTYTYGYNDGFTLSVRQELEPTKIEVFGGPAQVNINTNGVYYTDEDGQEYYYYYTHDLLTGKTVRITYNDGTYADYEYSPDMDIDGWSFNTYSEQEAEHWVPGGDNVMYLEYRDVECQVPVEVVVPSSTPIKQDKEYTYQSKEAIYYSFTPSKSGAYKFYSYNLNGCDPYAALYDSTFRELSYSDDVDNLAFSLVYELEAGKTYYYRVATYTDDEVKQFNFKLVQQKAATNLRIVSGEIVLIENVDGDIWGEAWDDYFHYSYYEKMYDMVFEVILDDGTKHQLQMGDPLYDVYLDYNDNQYDEHWYRDSENYISVTWLNKTIQVPVTIIENPVIGISIETEETPEYVLGNQEYMWSNGEGTYELYAINWEGYKLKVDYRDGSSQTYTLDKEGMVNEYYVDADYLTVNGTGEYQVTYSYMANECTLAIQVVDSPITSIEVTKDPTVVNIPLYVAPNFTGMEILITYADGTKKTITVTEEMLGFDNWNAAFTIKVDDIEILCTSNWNTSPMETVWNLHLLGRDYVYDGIVYTEKYAVEMTASNVTADGKGTKLTVTFNDGTSKEYVMDPIYTEKHGDYYSGVMKADGGLASYSIYIEKKHPDGTVCSGGMNIFDIGCSFNEEHIMSTVEAKAATCTADGNIAHYKCSCGQMFADEKGQQSLTAAQVKVPKHTVKKVKAVKATKKKAGNKAHYACSCGKLYLDAACKKPVSKGDVTVALVDKTSISKVTPKKKAITVKWKKKSGVTGYEVQVSLKKNFKKIAKTTTVKGAKKASATVKSLKAKKTYYVRVRAYKVVNGKAFYSDWSKVVKKKTK